MIKVLLVFGTRPEAIKLCPVLLLLRRLSRDFHVQCCVTAQHRSMLDQVLEVFDVVPDFDLDLMQPAQSLAQLSAGILESLENILFSERPTIVLVQGDTTTTFCAALSAFYRSEEHTSELQSLRHLVCRLLLEKKKKNNTYDIYDNGTVYSDFACRCRVTT